MNNKQAKRLREKARSATIGIPDVMSHEQVTQTNLVSRWATGSCKRVYRDLKKGRGPYTL